VAICHCIGCVMLLLGALIVSSLRSENLRIHLIECRILQESTVLLTFYLITSFVNTLILIICFVIVSITIMSIRPLYLCFILFLISELRSLFFSFHYSVLFCSITATSSYFYVVAYSYYRDVNSIYEDEDYEEA